MERDATALEADLERRLDFSEHPLDEAHRAITALTDYPGSAMSRSHRRASRSSATREVRFSGGESAAEE